MTKIYKLKLTSAVVIAGNPAPAGSIVDVDDALARRLLDTGKAELATVADLPEAEPVEPVEPPAPTEPKPKTKGDAK